MCHINKKEHTQHTDMFLIAILTKVHVTNIIYRGRKQIVYWIAELVSNNTYNHLQKVVCVGRIGDVVVLGFLWARFILL